MEQLIGYLNRIATSEGWPLSADCTDWLRTKIKTIKIRKGDYLLRPGEICRNLYFIESGLLKCFYIHKGNNVTDWFFGERETVASIDSFYDQVSSDDSIQAVEDCVLHYITHADLIYAYRRFVEFNVLGRVLTNKYLRIWHQQARIIRMLTADERFLSLMRTQPELFNRADLKDIASFLDMTSKSLSRARRNFRK